MAVDLHAEPLCEQHKLPPLTSRRMEELSVAVTGGAPAGPRECLELASTAGGPMRRKEDGLMEEWNLWAQKHPQCNASVDIHVGTALRFGARPSELSVVSWNTLSKTWLEACREDAEYVNVPPECFDWQPRAQRLVDVLLRLDADVVLLQEVDFESFESSFLQPLSSAGYEGLMQNPKKRAEDQPCATATFWKGAKLQLEWDDHRSRTLVTGMRFLTGPAAGSELAIVNVHLESSPAKFAARASQLHSALQRVSQRGSSTVLVAGDFNTGSDSAIHAVLRNQAWHGCALAAAYEHPAAAVCSQACSCTFAVAGGHRYAIDHLLYSYETLRLTTLLEALPAELRHACLGPGSKGLPDAEVPSDHIPIGATFSVHAKAAEPAAAAASPPKTKEDEAELWSSAANPLSQHQRETWEAFLAATPQKFKGKPSPEEIHAMQQEKSQRLDRERAFAADLTEEARAFLSNFKDGRAMLRRAL